MSEHPAHICGQGCEFYTGDAPQPTPKMRELLENPSVLERDAAQTEEETDDAVDEEPDSLDDPAMWPRGDF